MERRLDSVNINTRPGFAVSVILASQGYPGSYPKGKTITVGQLPQGKLTSPMAHSILILLIDVFVFHAGTATQGNDVVTSGGRVIAVSAHASTLQGALDAVYAGVEQVQFEGKTFRRDITHRYVGVFTPQHTQF